MGLPLLLWRPPWPPPALPLRRRRAFTPSAAASQTAEPWRPQVPAPAEARWCPRLRVLLHSLCLLLLLGLLVLQLLMLLLLLLLLLRLLLQPWTRPQAAPAAA